MPPQAPVQPKPASLAAKIMWGMTVLGAVVGLLFLVLGLTDNSLLGAANRLAFATTAIACVAVPYAAARAIDELTR